MIDPHDENRRKLVAMPGRSAATDERLGKGPTRRHLVRDLHVEHEERHGDSEHAIAEPSSRPSLQRS